MPRHLDTTLTFAVKLRLPARGHASSAQLYISEAILNWWKGSSDRDNPYINLQPEDFTVRLLKKETLYTTTRKDNT